MKLFEKFKSHHHSWCIWLAIDDPSIIYQCHFQGSQSHGHGLAWNEWCPKSPDWCIFARIGLQLGGLFQRWQGKWATIKMFLLRLWNSIHDFFWSISFAATIHVSPGAGQCADCKENRKQTAMFEPLHRVASLTSNSITVQPLPDLHFSLHLTLSAAKQTIDLTSLRLLKWSSLTRLRVRVEKGNGRLTTYILYFKEPA